MEQSACLIPPSTLRFIMAKLMKRYEVPVTIGSNQLRLFVEARFIHINIPIGCVQIAAKRPRAYFRPSKKQNTIGVIVFTEGDLEAVIHECGHAAHECVNPGWVPDNLCSRITDEERRCVAFGKIAESVLTKVRYAIP